MDYEDAPDPTAVFYELENRRPVSLWIMMNFMLGPIAASIRHLETLRGSLNAHLTAGMGTSPPPDWLFDNIVYTTKMAKTSFEEFNSNHINNAVEKLQRRIGKAMTINFAYNCIENIMEAIKVELTDRHFYLYDQTKYVKLKNWRSDWEIVIKEFPDCLPDGMD